MDNAALITSEVLPEDDCFHAQQCAEKALKALLLQRQVPYARMHAIEVLLDLLKTQGEPVPENVDEAFILTDYAVQTRYPGEWEPVTNQEAQKALELAALVLSWAGTHLEG